ncbi:hypothetical protein [Paenibacillus gallinarum]|uniref:Uncharacterized protein n=1 Tax=Paenibacillus gallinarum TaxID=2762232 RepID=A0ABR8T3Y2_9BACL|nr:hypothetical protein [Paenibacillus gallinarum]MBD7970486.1 hypothetical protein [Paenibacillus gallinarum]
MLILNGALANVNHEVSSDELLDFLKWNLPEADFYKLNPKPGSITASAFDWQAIISTSSSIITIAGVLWTAYKKFIVPLKSRGKTNAFLLVTIRNEKKEFTQFSIGVEYKNEQEFITDFTEKVERIRINPNTNELEIETREIKESSRWKNY